MKSNRTAVKALRSGCGKCSERGLGPCADGIAAAKKRWGPGSGRAAEGHSGGLPRGLGADCCWGFRAVTARCQQASCCVCGVRAGGGAVERWSERCFWRLWGLVPGCREDFRAVAGGVNGTRVAFAGSGRAVERWSERCFWRLWELVPGCRGGFRAVAARC